MNYRTVDIVALSVLFEGCDKAREFFVSDLDGAVSWGDNDYGCLVIISNDIYGQYILGVDQFDIPDTAKEEFRTVANRLKSLPKHVFIDLEN